MSRPVIWVATALIGASLATLGSPTVLASSEQGSSSTVVLADRGWCC